MSGKEIILLTAIVISGCTSVRKAAITTPAPVKESSMTLTDRLIASNLTAGDFDIVKADVEVFNNGENRKLISTVKYRKPGNYLVSVKHRTGVEAARIYITKDTVLINDRIYKTLYIGSNEYLLNKYGIETDVIPLIFGDYLEGLDDAVTLKDCKNGISEIQGYLDKKEIWYYMDCNRAKLSAVSVSDKAGTSGVNLNFSEFKKTGNKIYPSEIVFEDVTGRNKIIINIESIIYKDSERIEFIPGRNYKKVILK